MAYLYRAFALFVLYSVLGEWTNIVAANGTTTVRVVPSPTVSKNGSSTSNASSHHMTTTPSHNMTSVTPHNTTVIPHNMTVIPHNMTVAPHNMTVTPHNTTVTPHNTTVAPHNTTVTPSHNKTIMPHNSTVMPPHNMTITPSSAHTVMPTSSMHPTPTPAPKPGNFSIKENGTVCLFAYMAAQFDIMIVSKTLSLKLPTNANARGECDTSVQEPYITLNWQTMDGYSCNFTMHFVNLTEGETLKSSFKGRWAAANLTFSLKMNSSDAEPTYTFHSERGPLEQLSADYGYAYECLTAPINFKLNANNSNVNVTLRKIDFKPFDVQKGHLGNVEKCGTSTTANPPRTPTSKKSKSHVVPIAVGCSLAALVIIIGIGYIIGRRRKRNQAAGYRKL